ncbi:GNAT family N-acetyltransferase [Halomonas salinarum]|uniref:GNAT family N-acetyltransferase n=1 Tax=Halomonas salinarum TaxID=1158993 RepID=UPI00143A0403|nr:GNAT family N-acetyltransferase [Halomonas salinarum]
MTIRTAEEADAAEVARIHVETWRIAYAGIVPDSHLACLNKEDREDWWTRTLSNSIEGTRLAVLPDGAVVGWTSFGPSRDDDGQGVGELYAIYLDHSRWGQGMGRGLLDDAVLQLMNKGYRSITLWVLEENLHARRFYEMAGFHLDGASKVIEIDGKALVEIRYHRAVQPDAAPYAFSVDEL